MHDELLGLAGMALRAGRLTIGDDPCRELLLGGRARLVLMASDAGGGIVKKMTRLAQAHQVPLLTLPHSKEALGGALGRASCAVCATSDEGFAEAFTKKMRLLPRRKENQPNQ